MPLDSEPQYTTGFRGEEACVRMVLDVVDTSVRGLTEKEKDAMEKSELNAVAKHNLCL